MLLDELGRRIRERREKQGLKQQDIANALQISPQAVSKWERGENAPDLATLGPLARLLGVSTDWLLGVHEAGLDTFPATVFASAISGAYRRSLELAPADFAVWINGRLAQTTEAALRHDGVPVKYTGDGLLAFFSGAKRSERALEAALLARRIVGPDLRVGLSAGPIYLGAMGHSEYARPDIMGETVNLAFLIRDWADEKTRNGVAAAESVILEANQGFRFGRGSKVDFKNISNLIQIHEVESLDRKD
jgi:class 3 adenylate cyclase